MIVTKANLASYLAGLTPLATPYPIEITETITTDWGSSGMAGTVGNILKGAPEGVYTDLGSTTIPNSVTKMQDTFFYCTSLVNAPVIPNSVTKMQDTFYNCTSLVNAPVIPNSVTNMEGTFYNCTSLVNAPVIPNGVADMEGTFYNCTSLVNAPVIPSSVTDIRYTFYGCTSLVNAPVIPNSVIDMQYTFYGCTSLVNAPVIPNSVRNMQYTFYNCTSLVNTPVIPNSVIHMYYTFNNCTSLKTIGSFLVDVANCDMTNAFYNCPALEAIYVPAQEVDDWYLLYTDTKSTGTDYYTYDTAGTLLSSGTVAGTNQVLSVYGKSDELVISNTLTPERAIEAATTRLQHHKSGLPYNEESFVLNAKNPDNVICNFLDKYATTAWVKNQGYATLASPSITGSCTTNGTTNNTLALTDIVSALALEAGDVIQITGSTGGLNDKLFTVESITADNSFIVNYEHSGNRGNGSLKLANQTATVTIKRIAKWYNAPIGLGQAWVDMLSARAANITYTNTINRSIQVSIHANNFKAHTKLFVDQTEVCFSASPETYAHLFQGQAIVPSGSPYQLTGNTSSLKWRELR